MDHLTLEPEKNELTLSSKALKGIHLIDVNDLRQQIQETAEHGSSAEYSEITLCLPLSLLTSSVAWETCKLPPFNAPTTSPEHEPRAPSAQTKNLI